MKYAAIPGGAGLAAAEIAINKVNAGVGIAANLISTAKGLKALGGGSAGGGSNDANAGGGGGTTAPSFNLVQGTGSNQIAESLATEKRPLQAYVVASNVTTAQSLDRNIVDRSTMG